MRTSILLQDPTVVELKQKVSKTFGKTPTTPVDFGQLSNDILLKTHEHINADTLSRIWGYKKAYKTIRASTIHILECYISSYSDSEFNNVTTILSSDLKIGIIIHLTWMPNRECTLEYCGENQYKIIDIQNSKLSIGDTFTCEFFRIGMPVSLHNLVHQGKLTGGYTIGTKYGLSTCQVKES